MTLVKESVQESSMSIQGKRRSAFITGGAKRIGRALVDHFAEEGYHIALHYNSSEESALAVQKKIQSMGLECSIYRCDLSDLPAVESMMEQVCGDFSTLDLVINNASVFEPSDMRNTTNEFLQWTMAINLHAPLVISREYANRIGRGHIVNFVDATIETNNYRYCAYYLSKKGLADMIMMNAKELGPDIRVNGIAPGIILPPPGKDNSHVEPLIETVPLKRQGSLQDIVNAVHFLEKNEYVTGQIVFVDGGRHL
jgi:pteridine reductase